MPPETQFCEVGADGGRRAHSRAVADEVPIAIEVGGFGYAVLMATDRDLEDLTSPSGEWAAGILGSGGS